MICGMLFAASTAIEKDVIGTAFTIALLMLYLHSSDFHQYSTFNRSRAESLP